MFADVSTAAHGGQVLLDEPTFLGVKEAMWRLGAVGPDGLNYDALMATKSAGQGGSGSRRAERSAGSGCLHGFVSGTGLRCVLVLASCFHHNIFLAARVAFCTVHRHTGEEYMLLTTGHADLAAYLS